MCNSINLYDYIQNLQQNELRQDINDFLRGENNSPEAQGFALEAIIAMEEDPNTEIDFEDKIINQLRGKVLSIYDILTSNSIDFNNKIRQFDGDFPVAHLKFVNSWTLPNNINAQTLPPANYLIEIQINENKLDRPNLSIARTIIHETIHAEMFRKLLGILNNGGDLNGVTINEWNIRLSNGDYPGIFDYYSRYGISGMQHQQMAAHYRATISNMLQTFQPGLSQNIYDALAWVGLIGTTSWNALPQNQRDSIILTNFNFNSLGAE